MADPPAEAPEQHDPARPAKGHEYCIVGEMLCEVRTWTDEEWELMEARERPRVAEYVPGLGWIGAVPARNPARP